MIKTERYYDYPMIIKGYGAVPALQLPGFRRYHECCQYPLIL